MVLAEFRCPYRRRNYSWNLGGSSYLSVFYALARCLPLVCHVNCVTLVCPFIPSKPQDPSWHLSMPRLPSTIPFVIVNFTEPLSQIIKIKWILLFGQGIIIISMVLLHFADAPDRYLPVVIPALILGAAGCALIQTHAKYIFISMFHYSCSSCLIFSIAVYQKIPSSMAGTIAAILACVTRLGASVGLAIASAIQTSVEAKHRDLTNYAGLAASFWFILALVCVSVASLLTFYRNEAEGNDLSTEGVTVEKVDESMTLEVLEAWILAMIVINFNHTIRRLRN